MHNCGTVLMAVLNLFVQIKIPLATFYSNHPITESMQTINHYFSPEAS
jgi:hypothetical protein